MSKLNKVEKKSYIDKLKDPRWQKMRLKILERDEWICQICFSSEKTLHIHHKYYLNRNYVEPWDYPLDALITLCEECHGDETILISEICHDLIKVLRTKFMARELDQLKIGFYNMKMVHIPGVIASAIEHSLSTPENLTKIIDIYFDYLRETRRTALVEEWNRELHDSKANGCEPERDSKNIA